MSLGLLTRFREVELYYFESVYLVRTEATNGDVSLLRKSRLVINIYYKRDREEIGGYKLLQMRHL